LWIRSDRIRNNWFGQYLLDPSCILVGDEYLGRRDEQSIVKGILNGNRPLRLDKMEFEDCRGIGLDEKSTANCPGCLAEIEKRLAERAAKGPRP